MGKPNARHLAPVLACAAVLGLAWQAPAAVVSTMTGPFTAPHFTVSGTDLVNAGQSTLANVTAVSPTTYGGQNLSYANNGATDYSGSTGNTNGSFGFNNNGTLTFTLNTTLNPAGYEVNSIDVLSGFDGRRTSHNYKVEFAYVSDPGTFISVGQVGGPDAATRNNDTGIQGTRYEIQSILTDTTGALGTGVAAIRFTFWDDAAGNAQSVYREIDVLGSAVVAVPTPAALSSGLALLGLVGLKSRRRR